MAIQLSDHFTTRKILRFTLPSIAMILFTSLYGVVDGFFVSNFAGKTPFAAVNFIMPFIMILGTFGFMFGTGGSALVSKTMGEGQAEKANRLFSMLVCVAIGTGVILAVGGIAFIRVIAVRLGAEGEMLEECVQYGRIVLMVLPGFMLQHVFESFFVAAEKPQLGFAVTVAAGVANMGLDWLFIAVFGWGIAGAASATAISQLVGGFVPVVYFLRPRSARLRLTVPEWDGRALLKTCTNGSSELMTGFSMSFISMLYNMQLMKYAGENGIAANGVLMYVGLFFVGVFIGYSVGTAPVIGFHYGAQNHAELRSLLQKSLCLIGASSVVMLLLGEVLSTPFSMLFVGYDPALLALTKRAFLFYSFSFLFAGIAIFGSGFFTALNNGLISALISFLRTLVFETASVLLLPLLWGTDGIWCSCVIAEGMAALVTAVFLLTQKKRYHYGKEKAASLL